MNSEYSNSEPIKLSKSSYTILCHKIIYDVNVSILSIQYKCSTTILRDCSFEIREGGGQFGGRVIKFLTSFLGGFKIYNTRFGGYKFSYIKLLGFNCLAKYSALQLIKTAFISPFDG